VLLVTLIGEGGKVGPRFVFFCVVAGFFLFVFRAPDVLRDNCRPVTWHVNHEELGSKKWMAQLKSVVNLVRSPVLRLLILKLEIFKIALPSNNGFPDKNTVNEQYMYFS